MDISPKLDVNSRTIALLGQAFFGFTGITRIYLSSYVVGIIQFILFLTALIIFSQETTTPETFVAATILLLLITLIWLIDSYTLAANCIRVSPQPIWNWRYYWSPNTFDMTAGRVLGIALLLAIPAFLISWLFTGDR